MACPASEKPSRAWISTGPRPSADDSCGAGNSNSYIPVWSGWYCCSGISGWSAICFASSPRVRPWTRRTVTPSVAHFAVDAIAAPPICLNKTPPMSHSTSGGRRGECPNPGLDGLPTAGSRQTSSAPYPLFGQDRLMHSCARRRAVLMMGLFALLTASCAHPEVAIRDPSTAAAAEPETPPTARSVPADPRVGAVFLGGDSLHACSGGVLDSANGDLILTAAHCLSDGTDATFVPGFNN